MRKITALIIITIVLIACGGCIWGVDHGYYRDYDHDEYWWDRDYREDRDHDRDRHGDRYHDEDSEHEENRIRLSG